ncbi:MAG TPA: hypothetical protein G4N93_03875 [Dehalococcoidia bacterium]|nr:hypothetical protein [Dehalococcoidia bacterium]
MTEEEIQALKDELETTKSALGETKTELESVRGELGTAQGERDTYKDSISAKEDTITQLEQAVASKDSDILILKQAASDSDVIASEAKQSLANAVSSYKTTLSQANPAIPVHLITGDTIEAIDESLVSAQTMVDQVRTTIEAEIAAGRVPAGAPARTPPDLSALSPREKIQYAITKS